MEISLKAFAKINLSLDITGKREDGYHTLDSVMQSVSLFDIVNVTNDNSGIVTVECDGINGEDNICYFAAKHFLEAANINDGVKIRISKAIPVSAGMGGGSTDAAAVLVALNKLYGFPLSDVKLGDIALKLGADVPFFLVGGTARAKGIGEILEPIENNLSYALVLIKKGEKPSTKYMYEEIDNRQNKDKQWYTKSLCDAIIKNDFVRVCESIGNDFDELWDNAALKEELYELGAKKVCLSGSGPTVFGVFENTALALSAAAVMREKYNNVYTAVPTKEAYEFE